MNLLTPKNDGLLIASMPSSGSDWLADCFMEANPELKYSREHFSPLCNLGDSEILSPHFGDYLYSCTRNLTTPLPDRTLNGVLEYIWRPRGHTFTKENYLAFKLESMSKRFNVVVLARRTEDTFPPTRQRVTAWYEHAFCALDDVGMTPSWADVHVKTPMDMAVVGHKLYLRKLVSEAERLGLPILWWHDLVDQDKVEEVINPTTMQERFLVEIIKLTGKPRKEPDPHYAKLYLDSLRLLELL